MELAGIYGGNTTRSHVVLDTARTQHAQCTAAFLAVYSCGNKVCSCEGFNAVHLVPVFSD